MNRKNMDDIFRDGLKNYSSDIDPNEIWAGIQEKKPNQRSDDDDDKKPFAWWILGTLLLLVSASVMLSSVADKQRRDIETAEAKLGNMGILNTNTTSTTSNANTTTATAPISDADVIETTILKSAADKSEINKLEQPVTKSENNSKKKINSNISISPSNFESTTTTKKGIITNSSFENNSNQTTIISSPTTMDRSSRPTTINNAAVIKEKIIAVDFLENREAIPVIPMTDEAEDYMETEIADLRIPESEIAQGCYGGPAVTFAIGAHLSPDLVMHRISSTNQDLFPYIDERRKTENLLESFHGGLDVYLQHRDGLFLRSGIEYAQINKRFKYEQTWIEMSDSSNIITTNTRTKKTTNRYRMVDIPLTVGYEFAVYDWNLSLFVEAGASMNVLFKTKGDILDPNSPAEYYEPISITDGEENSLDSYVDNVGLSFLGGIGVRYELMDGLFIYAQPAGKLYLNSFTKKDNEVNEKFSRFGINIGALYKL